MTSGKPTREQADLAEVLEMVLDKGIVINADIAVTVGETELLGIELRAAIASFETAAKYGLSFPSGTDMRRVEQASGRQSLEGEDGEPIDLGIDASSGGAAVEEAEAVDSESEDDAAESSKGAPGRRPTPTVMTGGSGGDGTEEPADEGGETSENESADDDTDEGDAGESSADDSDAADGGDA